MTTKTLLPLAAALVLASLLPGAAQAQFGRIPGMVNLPPDDFTWFWGNHRDGATSGFEDFSVSGYEAGFSCELTGKLHPGSRMTPFEVRELENELRQSLAFIQTTAEAMYILDQQREIEWAKLDCDKPDEQERTPEQSAERTNRALEKARREQAERRAREQRRNDD